MAATALGCALTAGCTSPTPSSPDASSSAVEPIDAAPTSAALPPSAPRGTPGSALPPSPPLDGGARAGAEDAEALTTPGVRRRYVVAAMGDSLTDPRSHGGGYLELLAERCPESRFDSYGVGGQMVNQMRRRFARDVLGEPPDPAEPKPHYTHVIVLGGINDICSDETAKRTARQIRGDLGSMYAAARAHGIRVIALTMPPWAGFSRYYNPRREATTLAINDWIRAQGRDGTVDAVLDVYPLLSCGAPTFLCERFGWPDHVHWNAEGHRVVGEALYRAFFADCR